MTQFSQSGPAFSNQRIRNPRPGRAGQNVSLQSPPQTPVANIPRRSDLSSGFSALQSIASGLSAVAQVVEAENDAERQVLEGQAIAEGRRFLPQVLDRISRGLVEVPEGQEIEQVVDGIIQQETQGLPEVYANAFSRVVAPSAIQGLIGRRNQVSGQIGSDAIQALSSRATLAESPGSLMEILESAKQIPGLENLSDTQLRRQILLPVLEHAAALGNEGRGLLSDLSEALGDDFRLEVTAAERRLEANDLERQGLLLSGEVADFRVAASEGRLDAEQLDRFVASNPGLLSADQVAGIKTVNGRAREAIASGSSAKAFSARVEQAKARVQDEILAQFSDPQGSISALKDQEVEVTLGDRSRKIRFNEIIERATNVMVSRIAAKAEAEGRDPDVEVAAFLQSYGLESKAFTNRMQDGFTAANQQVRDIPAVERGLDLYLKLNQWSPIYANKFIDDDTARFYTLVQDFQRFSTGNNIDQAIEQALLSMNTAGEGRVFYPQELVNDAVVKATSEDVFFGLDISRALIPDFLAFKIESIQTLIKEPDPPKNIGQVADDLKLIASQYRVLGAEKALDKAAEVYASRHANINGWMVFVGNNNTPQDLKRVADIIIKDFSPNLENQGIRAEDLTIIPLDRLANTWTLWNHVTSQPVNILNDKDEIVARGIFTNRELQEILSSEDKRLSDLERIKRESDIKRTSQTQPINNPARIQSEIDEINAITSGAGMTGP